jgi:hypothetical protein
VGFSLLAGGFQARAWPLTLAVGGLFYGVFGTLRLDVQLDWVLVLGALALAASVFAQGGTWATSRHRTA